MAFARSPSCSLEPGPGTVEFEVDEIGLQPGMYYVSATIVHTDQVIGMSKKAVRRRLG